MNKLIAYCGLDCGSKCPYYTATQADDREALEKAAETLCKKYNSPDITADFIVCDGCSAGGRLSGYCKVCKIRECAINRGIDSCALCLDYETCKNLTAYHRQLLESFRSGNTI